MSFYHPIKEANGFQWAHQPYLTPLYLPDDLGRLRFLGLVQDHVVNGIDWDQYGFRLVTPQDGVYFPWYQDGLGSDAENPRKRIVPTCMLYEPAPGRDRVQYINDNLLEIIQDPIHRGRIPSFQMWAIDKDPDEKKYAHVIAAHDRIEIPDHLGAHFGLVTAGVHLNLYTRDPDGNIDKMWVQVRSPTASSYPNRFGQAVAGGVQHGETFRQAVIRETAEATGDEALAKKVRWEAELDGYFTFCTRRKQDAGHLRGLIEPGLRACYSLQVDDDFQLFDGKDEDVEFLFFVLLRVEHVEAAIREMQFEPSCALAMLKFFLVKRIFTEENERQYDDIVEGLRAPLPYPVIPLGRLSQKKNTTMQNLYTLRDD